ncbi:hypothetical protein ACFYRI_14595 [Streptomyces microflavus]|uniref:hypothetical protein n=1 Tax=Streptomyces microflavus TaxID=1919 RepID=UPI0036A8F51B
MPEKPYTDEDLRAEAARQLADAELPELETVGEQMRNADIASRSHWNRDAWWHSLSDTDRETAQTAIHGLIEGAADVSEWAVNLGADGLEPVGLNLNINDSSGEHRVRLHFAFAPDMDKAIRQEVMDLVADAIRRT